ncbi:MAG: ArsA family ATPase, partial [Actinomycetota bacterium]|nr:ArsA family ATPase [Actinomycetota bacterium]
MRVVLFTGKGGVGKTTVAASTAVRAARGGYRTLIMSTDPAHSLADSFEIEIGSKPSEVIPNLWAVQIDAQERLEENWREIQDYFIQLMNWAGTETIQAEELTVIPGLDEIFALIDVKTQVESGDYDMLVVDCAPTAETLRLLSLPEIMNWYIERVFPVERRIVKTVRPMLTKMTSLPIAGDTVFAAVERLHRNLDAVKQILTDEHTSSV